MSKIRSWYKTTNKNRFSVAYKSRVTTQTNWLYNININQNAGACAPPRRMAKCSIDVEPRWLIILSRKTGGNELNIKNWTREDRSIESRLRFLLSFSFFCLWFSAVKSRQTTRYDACKSLWEVCWLPVVVHLHLRRYLSCNLLCGTSFSETRWHTHTKSWN